MIITKLTGLNIKGQTFEHAVAPITIFTGPNGVGKTARLNAVALTLNGALPGRKTNRAIHELASGATMQVGATFDNGIEITREWTRSGKTIRGTGTNNAPVWPAIMLDPEIYFGVTANRQIAMIFEAIGEGLMVDGRRTSAEEFFGLIRGRHPDDAEVERMLGAIPDPDDVIATMDYVVQSMGELRKIEARELDRTVKTLQGLTTLRLEVDQAASVEQQLKGVQVRQLESAAAIGVLRAQLERMRKQEEANERIATLLAIPGVVRMTRLEAQLFYEATIKTVEGIRHDVTAARQSRDKAEVASRELATAKVRLATFGPIASNDNQEAIDGLRKELGEIQETRGGLGAAMEHRSAIDQDYFQTASCADELKRQVEAIEQRIKCMLSAQACPVCGSARQHWRETGDLRGKLDIALMDLGAAELKLQRLAQERQAAAEWIETEMRRDDIARKIQTLELAESKAETARQHRLALEERITTLEQEAKSGTVALEELEAALSRAESEIQIAKASVELADMTEADAPDISAIEAKIYDEECRQQDLVEEFERLRALDRQHAADKAELRRLLTIEKAAEAKEQELERYRATEKWLREIMENSVGLSFAKLLAIVKMFTKGIFQNPIEIRDHELGRYRAGVWCPVGTFSGSEQAIVYCAVQAALTISSNGRILIIDELGRIDQGRLAAFLRNIVTAVQVGTIDQFFGADITGLAEQAIPGVMTIALP